jgi:hypothetical protein
MLPPNNTAIRHLSQEEGISAATLRKWRAEARGKGQLLPDADAGPEGWSSRDKFAAVLETAALNEADLAEYCRKRGLFPEQIKAWRVACEQANDWAISLCCAAALWMSSGATHPKALSASNSSALAGMRHSYAVFSMAW